jgi:hypothetical protein
MSQPGSVHLEILDGVTGAVLNQGTVVVPPGPSTAHPPNPCVQWTVPTTATFPGGPGELLIGVALVNLVPGCTVCVNPQPLPPGGVVASLSVFMSEANGMPTAIRSVPLHPPQPCAL